MCQEQPIPAELGAIKPWLVPAAKHGMGTQG